MDAASKDSRLEQPRDGGVLMQRKVRRRWRKGQAPKDGKTYEMRRRFRVSTDLKSRSPYAFHTAVWSPYAWWNGEAYVEKNQFSGGERWLNQPNEWRESPNDRTLRQPPGETQSGTETL